jgi:hypothetical protein
MWYPFCVPPKVCTADAFSLSVIPWGDPLGVALNLPPLRIPVSRSLWGGLTEGFRCNVSHRGGLPNGPHMRSPLMGPMMESHWMAPLPLLLAPWPSPDTDCHRFGRALLCLTCCTLISARGFTRRPDDGGSTNLWNCGKLIPIYTALQPRGQPSSNRTDVSLEVCPGGVPWRGSLEVSNKSVPWRLSPLGGALNVVP